MGGDPNYLLTGKALQVDTRWWQLKYVYFHAIVGAKNDSQFDETYFSNGWLKNHHPGYYIGFSLFFPMISHYRG